MKRLPSLSQKAPREQFQFRDPIAARALPVCPPTGKPVQKRKSTPRKAP